LARWEDSQRAIFFGVTMPWSARDAKRHTKKAKSATAQRQWAHISNSMLERGYDEGRAIAAANSVVKKRGRKKSRRSRRHSRSGRS
jgi:uncharacterized protein YdaT